MLDAHAISENQLAERLGVNRSTIREWSRNRGFSLVAVETKQVSLAEWAAGAEAVNLLTDETSPSAIPDDVRDDLDSVTFDGGRNGWTGPDEKAYARRHLLEQVRAGRLSPDQAASYVTSRGASDRGANRLRELLQRDSHRRR